MSEALFHTSCPSCGAPIHTHSATAVTVVCSYCNSMLLRQDSSLHDTGRDSALLQDFSPLQIGTTGKYANRGFTLIGRLQAQYDAGVWNEWYALFDDGSHGWLSEAGDLYVLLFAVLPPNSIPEFASIRAAETTISHSKRFIASDVRQIVLDQAAVQGELPFVVPNKMHNRVADFRCEEQFMTLDYGSEPPQCFVGRTVALADLSLANTRTDEQIRQSAGSLRGTRAAEQCGNCGAPMHWVRGITHTVICASCGSDWDLSSGKAELHSANAMRLAQEDALPLPLGQQGTLNGIRYTVIGAVYRVEISAVDARLALENTPKLGVVPQGWWREYLLYSMQHGFAWLVETSDGEWSLSQTQAAFPRLNTHGEPQGAAFLYDYGGQVAFAAGAFYWHIRKGDVQLYRDYRVGNGKLSAEISNSELAWSKSTPMTYRTIAQAFGLKVQTTQYTAKMEADKIEPSTVWYTIAAFVLINLPTLWTTDDVFGVLFISGIAIWILYSMAGLNEDSTMSKTMYLIFATIVILGATFMNYSTSNDNGNGSRSYIGTGTSGGGFSGGHK